MNTKQKYITLFVLAYGLSVLGLSQFHKKSSLDLVPFTIQSDETREVNFESIYSPDSVSESLTVGFKLDFVQRPLVFTSSDSMDISPASIKWEQRSHIFKDLFNMIHYSGHRAGEDLTSEDIGDYVAFYKAWGYDSPAQDHINLRDIQYHGLYNVHLFDGDLDTNTYSTCRVFEHKKDNYRAIVIYQPDGSYDVLFDTDRNIVVNYMYHHSGQGVKPLGLYESARLEEEIYSSLVNMVESNSDRVDLNNKLQRMILLKQVDKK